MKTNWDLDALYRGFSDPEYEADIKRAEEAYKALHEAAAEAKKFAAENADPPAEEKAAHIERLLLCKERIAELSEKLGNYVGLRQAVNTKDGEIMAQMARLMRMDAAAAEDDAAAMKILGKAGDVEALAELSPVIREHKAYILEAEKQSRHMLSDEVESMAAAMDLTGGSAWGQLQSYMTSTLKVDYKDTVITLSEVRNLAYSPEADVRRDAYDAELKAYEKVQDAIAFSLNNIKNQVTMMAEKRGYASPLDMTLQESRMSRETLDAMLEAMKEYMPAFRKYLKKKGELLGDENGLKFYNIFAPLASSDKEYTVEDAKEELTSAFRDFTPEMSDMMADAFEHEWIDFFPADGKEGGAFCAGVPSLKQSRILTNFDGTFGAVDTLAHELGHAYHNLMQENERLLNMDAPMPVAETASTFNETFLGARALKNAETREEKLALIESDLKEKTQCVVDIYSRYLFETAVFEQARDRFLMPDDLKEIMLDAQDQSYGDGLDPAFRHPYMWACKSHYYSSGLSFYNFPYAFGNLFAEGLYALYLKDPEGFLPKYREMLRTTGVHSVEECGEMMGIDLTKKDFWEASLKMIADEIDEFCEL